MVGLDNEVLTVVADSRGRLDAVLSAATEDYSRSRVASLIREGAVKVDGQVCTRPSIKVLPGARLELLCPALTPSEVVAQDIPLDIVYQDEDVAVINKVAGMVVHPAPGHPEGTLVNALLHWIDDLSGIGGVERPGLVHRLDRGTSGLLVVAKHDKAHRHLAAQFEKHTAGRRYLALCMGNVPEGAGVIRSYLARHPTDRKRWASTDGHSGRHAVTHYRVRSRSGRVVLVECRLETGRTHQVRVHMTELGIPLLGDGTYRRNPLRVPDELKGLIGTSRPMLHAWKLRFEHPSQGRVCEFVVPPPADFAAAAAAIGIELPVAEPAEG